MTTDSVNTRELILEILLEVTESFAVIDAITEAETQKKNSASYTPPVEDILITGIEITTYEGPELKQPIPDAPESVMQQTESTESSATATK